MLTIIAVGPGVKSVLGDVQGDVVRTEPGDAEHQDEKPFPRGRPHPATSDQQQAEEQGADE